MLRVSSAVAAPRTAADPGARYLRWNIPLLRSGTLKIESGGLQLHSRGGPQRPGLLTRKSAIAPRQMGRTWSETEADAKLEADIVAAALHLREHGWAIIDDVLSREDCEGYISSVWDWLEGLDTGISRADSSTWQAPHWPPAFKGIINSLEVSHQAFVWRVRSNMRLIKIFAILWGTNELLSSFDSINCLPPSGSTGIINNQTSWLHADQAPLRRGFFCIQGLVNMVNVGPDTTGTLLVKDKSHEGHAPFFETACTLSHAEMAATTDHYQLKPQELPFFDSYETLGLRGKAGSVFLWDSRTIHANTVPELTEHWRHVVYACYQPRRFAKPGDLRLKAEAWDEYRVTTHWPARNIALFPKSQPGKGYYGEEVAAATFTLRRDRDELDDQRCIRRLAGVEQYQDPEPRNITPLLEMPEDELHARLYRLQQAGPALSAKQSAGSEL